MITGETTTEILAAVIRAEPDWTMLPTDVPPCICDLLKRCLAKDDKRRLRDIGDARLELDTPADATLGAASMPPRPLWRSLPWAIAIAAIVIAAWALLHPPAATLLRARSCTSILPILPALNPSLDCLADSRFRLMARVSRCPASETA